MKIYELLPFLFSILNYKEQKERKKVVYILSTSIGDSALFLLSWFKCKQIWPFKLDFHHDFLKSLPLKCEQFWATLQQIWAISFDTKSTKLHKITQSPHQTWVHTVIKTKVGHTEKIIKS